MSKKSFILHYDSLDVIEALTDEQVWKLFRKMKSYHNWNTYESNDKIVDIVFIQFKNQFDRDKEKFNNVCEKNKQIALNRWNKESTKSTTGILGVPESTKSTDNDNDNDNESDKDSNKENKKDYFKKYQEYIENNNTLTSIILKTFLELWYKPNEPVDKFREWVVELNWLVPLTSDKLKQTMFDFKTYRKDKDNSKANWKSRLNTFLKPKPNKYEKN